MKAIAAVSTPLGAGGIGIVRVSGEDALALADAVFVCRGSGAAARLAAAPLTLLFGDFIARDFRDRGYAVYFPAPRAYTGEDTVEFYLHGGVRLLGGALDALLEKGARLAGRGEFTKRAYLSGKLNLADAEGVADMISAESAAGLRAAYRMMNGSVSRGVGRIADELMGVIAGLEAALDFPEELEDEVLPPLNTKLESIIGAVEALFSTARAGRIAREGLNVALTGKPNVGKSSLLNAMLGCERAIVTPIAGTTRDTVEGSFECGGVKINLIDTAGIRESRDEIERIGVEKARAAVEGADVVLCVIDTAADGFSMPETVGNRVFYVFNKCDRTSFACPRRADCFAVSAKTGEGVPELARALAALYSEGGVEGGEIITSQRHISALYRAKSSLQSAVSADCATIDCILIDLREAYDALGEITGATATEAVVDAVFEKFCIGK